MRLAFKIVAIFYCLFLFQSAVSFANDAPINLESGGARALSRAFELTVKMESETVNIVLGEKSYVVDAVFNFRNKGKTMEVDVGFPKNGMGSSYGDFPHTSDFIKFETWINGLRVAFEEVPNVASIEGEYTLPDLMRTIKQTDGAGLHVKDFRWMAKQNVRFPSNEVTTTRVRYEAPYYGNSLCKGLMSYIYGTGKYWNGNIGKSTFIIDTTGIPEDDRPPRDTIYFRNKAIETKVRWMTQKAGILKFVIEDYKPENADDSIGVGIGCADWGN